MSAQIFVPLNSQNLIRRLFDFKPRIRDNLSLYIRINKNNKNKNMCVQVSASPEFSQTVIRRSADFTPSIWGDFFLSFTPENTERESEQRLEEYKEEVRKMILADQDLSHKLYLIDAVQRLGVPYHFEKEIDESLLKIFHSNEGYETDLYTVALKFRLLRQQGHFVTCDVFNKFKDDEGKFKECLMSDARGMLSLYEATHLRIHGDEVLDEALAFTTIHLQSLASSTSNPCLADQIRHALHRPLHKGLLRLEARHYMRIYEQDASRNDLLLTFAKLDYNQLQKLHQKELREITRWWEDLDFATKLPFARNRIVESYFFMFALYYEPQYSLGRRMLTKVMAMTSAIDDIYDVYGMIEELALFTDAAENWDASCLEQLPEYMQVCYAAFLDVYKEMEENMALQGRSYRVSYAKQAMTDMIKGYFQEAKWFHQNYTPTMDEYLTAALKTAGFSMLTTASWVGMGEIVTKQSFEWLFADPEIIVVSPIIARFMDDIVTSKFEQKRGHVASSIECYMNEHEGATEEEAISELRRQVSDAWKVINRECLLITEVPMTLLVRIVNLARLVDVVYKDEDGYTSSGIKDLIVSLFVEPVPIHD